MYQIVFDHIESGAAMDAAQEFREMGHRVLTAEEAGEITPDILVRTVGIWESDYGDIRKLHTRAVEDRLPKATALRAKTYLTTVRF